MFFEHTYADELSSICTPITPSGLDKARLALFNHELADEIGYPSTLRKQESLFSALFTDSGELAQHAVAQKYGGHQFGVWNPELGDGRGLLLGEISKGNNRYDLHLKGAGQTPYSRFGDGRAVLRSTIREYLASEALHGLGIPTSRALCLITSDSPVQREETERGAMLIRVCQSHIRFGHFEYFYHSRQTEQLSALFDYCFKYHFAHCAREENPHLALLTEIVHSTAELVAKWQAYGFCHGVMNTDNMSVHGITFDYGPYAFLDDFEPGYICNHSDHSGRYAFDRQPGVALWNLNALAHAFRDYLTIDQLKACLEQFQPVLTKTYSRLMLSKLGLQHGEAGDNQLLNDWLALLEQDKRDYTFSFRLLNNIDADTDCTDFIDHFIDREKAKTWCAQYQQRLSKENASSREQSALKQAHNPKFILRNFLAQEVIDAAEQDDFGPLRAYLEVLKHPFDEQTDATEWARLPPDWGKSMEISCSS